MIAIVYCRVSTEDQARHGYSLIDQLDACKKKAQALGATDIIECVDEGISGSILERPGLTRARDLIRQGHIDLFVCYDPDRLARNLSHQLIVTEEIERAGVRLEFINFDWKDTPEGKLFYSLRGAIAEYEKEKIRERTMRGIRRKVLSGQVPLYPGTYGYRPSESGTSIEIEPHEAAIVRQMYEWCAYEDMGGQGIATRLNDLGIPSPRGAKWDKTVVLRLLRNPAYRGEMICQRTDKRGMVANKYLPAENRVRVREYPKDHWVTVCVPAIVPEKLWHAARERMARARRLRSGHAVAQYLLTGLARCGLCGAPLHGNYAGYKQHRRPYYTCNGRSPGIPGRPRCMLPFIQRDYLEHQVWSRIVLWVQDPDELHTALREQYQNPVPTAQHSELEIINRELMNLVQERSRLLNVLQKGLAPESEIEERLAELRRREVALVERKSQLTAYVSAIPILPSSEEIRKIIRRVCSTLDGLTFEERKKLIRMLIDQVVVMPNEIIIHARIPMTVQPSQ